MPKARLSPRYLTIGLLFCALVISGCRLPAGPAPISDKLLQARRMTQQGRDALERQDLSRAERLLRGAVELSNVDAESRRLCAEVMWKRGDRDAAVAQMDAALKLAPDEPSLLESWAQMQYELGKNASARKAIEEVLDIDPKRANAWYLHGEIMRQIGDPRRALADYHQALRFAPQDEETLMRLAETYAQLNEPRRALANLEALQDIYPPGQEQVAYLVLLGRTYAALDRNEDAVRWLAQVRLRGLADQEVLYSLAVCHQRLGQPDAARHAALAALALQPQHAGSQALLQSLNIAGQPAPPRR